MKIRHNVSLKKYHTFGVEVKADTLLVIRSVKKLTEHLSDYQNNNSLFLGQGSNVLFTKDFKGIIFINKIKGTSKPRVKKLTGTIKISAASGENWHKFVVKTLVLGCYGLENLSLIPGTVGAAPIQNIGAYGTEVSQWIESVDTINLLTQEKRIFSKNECEFGYRSSIFKTKLKGKYIITKVNFSLLAQPKVNISYPSLKNYLLDQGSLAPSPQQVSKAVIAIRSSKLPNPKKVGNAGSFFKNPVVPIEKLTQLLEKYPSIPHYSDKKGFVKIPAAWLIDQAGWKGYIKNGAGSHPKQALVLVNYGNASGQDILSLSKRIQLSIKEKFRIQLVPEVNII